MRALRGDRLSVLLAVVVCLSVAAYVWTQSPGTVRRHKRGATAYYVGSGASDDFFPKDAYPTSDAKSGRLWFVAEGTEVLVLDDPSPNDPERIRVRFREGELQGWVGDLPRSSLSPPP
jgi:hypothetical protein